MRLNYVSRGHTLRIVIGIFFTLMLLSNGAGAITPASGLSGGTIIVSGASTATLTVNAQGGADYTKIQDAIDNAYDGYTILVSGGTTSTLTYYENVNVNKRLLLHGVDEGAGQPVVDAGGSGSAITLLADWISLDGFKAVNSGYLYPNAGIRIISNNNFITKNSASNNELGMLIDMNSSSNDVTANTFNYNTNGGLYLHVNSRNNIIRDNTADHNTNYFIYLADSYYNTVSGNRVSGGNMGIYVVFWNKGPGNNRFTGNDISNTYYEGISLYYTDNNTISGNSVNSSNGYGIYLYSSSNNVIYDNYFNNVNNMASWNSINMWNIGKIPGRNIIGGEYLGGNYWAGQNWTGFSQTCTDTDHDGICDNPYSLDSNNTDYLPLTDVIYVDSPPVADAGAFQLVYAGDTVYFDGSGSTDDKGIALYEWDFESDGIYDATGINASHIYSATGNYTVKLRVTDTINQTDTDITIVAVKARDSPPVAEAGAFQLVYAGDTVYFDGSGSTDDNGIVLYEWDFESDGIYDASGINASHIYTAPGNYTVKLRVTDTINQTDTDITIVAVKARDSPPVADAGAFQLVYAGDTVYFDGSGSIDDNGIVLYEWDFESDGIYDASGITASHIYTAPGNYTVKLRVTDTVNQADTDITTVVVNEPVYSGVISSLITDKPKYLRGQTVYTTSAVKNTGNRDLDAQVRFTYQKPDLSIALIETKSVMVPIGGSFDALSSYTIPSKGSTQGTWTVKAELIYGSQILDVKTVTFQGINKL